MVGVHVLYAKGKEVEFTFHAQRRMSERRMNYEQVAEVIERPDTEGQARSKGCRRAERRLGVRTFGVVYREEREVTRIITVW